MPVGECLSPTRGLSVHSLSTGWIIWQNVVILLCYTRFGDVKCKINRLFEIVYILLDKKTITAKELANRFEVSVRTIYRDIDTLSAAGIPLYTSKGKGGGISILDDFILNKSLFSEQEQNEILMSLQSLSAVKSARYRACS